MIQKKTLLGGASLSREVLVGLTQAIIILPQAIAFSTTLAGLPPYFGIYAAIWGVVITALINPSRGFGGGPNSSMAVVIGITLLPLSPQFGSDYVGLALTMIFIAGMIQILFASVPILLKVFDFLSDAVITGLISGIGVLLIYKSFAAFGGLPQNTQSEWQVQIAYQTFLAVFEVGNGFAFQIGLVTLLTIIVLKQFEALKSFAILTGVAVGTGYSVYLGRMFGEANLLVERTGNLSQIPLLMPSMPTLSQASMPDVMQLIPGAITLALLGLVQSIVAMRKVNRHNKQFVSSRQCAWGDAIANVALSFLSSLPTCASFNRMALVQKMGGATRLVAFSSVAFLMLFLLLFGDILALIPIPAMAAIIMVVGYMTVDFKMIREIMKNRVEAMVFMVSFASIHIFGLAEALAIGAAMEIIHFHWRKSHPFMEWVDNVLHIHGSLYYASIPRVEEQLESFKGKTPALCLNQVFYVDTSAERWLTYVENVRGLEVQRDIRKSERDEMINWGQTPIRF